MEHQPEPVLQLRSTSALRRHGIKGMTSLSFEEGHLVFIGAKGGQLLVAPSGIIRLRSGIDTKFRNGPWFHTSVWLHAAPQRLKFVSNRFDMANYAAVFGALAEAMAAEDGLARIEIGTGRTEALMAIVPMVFLALAALWVGLFALPHEVWWLRLLPATAPLLLIAVFAVVGRRSWPRRPATMTDYVARLKFPTPRLQLRWHRRRSSQVDGTGPSHDRL